MENEKTLFESALKNYIEKRNDVYYLSSDTINFYTLFNFLFTDAILCNNIENIDNDFFYNVEIDENDENDEDYYPEFYQYYIVNVDEWRLEKYKEYLKENNLASDISLFYSDILENYIVGISHYGTSWTCVPTSIKIERKKNNE